MGTDISPCLLGAQSSWPSQRGSGLGILNSPGRHSWNKGPLSATLEASSVFTEPDQHLPATRTTRETGWGAGSNWFLGSRGMPGSVLVEWVPWGSGPHPWTTSFALSSQAGTAHRSPYADQPLPGSRHSSACTSVWRGAVTHCGRNCPHSVASLPWGGRFSVILGSRPGDFPVLNLVWAPDRQGTLRI